MTQNLEVPSPKRPNRLSSVSLNLNKSVQEEEEKGSHRTGSTPVHRTQNEFSKGSQDKKLESLAKYARKRDQFLFTTFLFLIILNAYYVGADPTGALVDLNLFTYIVLVGIRSYRFAKHRIAFYLVDYCYVGNTMVWVGLYFFRYSPIAFNMAYFFGVGSLGWSIVAWNNGYILHSIDQMTTVFIHHTSFVVLTAMRWSSDPKLQAAISAPGGSLVENIGYCLAFYLTWVVSYYLFMFVFCWNYIQKHDYDCLYKYTVKVSPASRILIFLCGNGKSTKPLFMLTHMIWVLGTGFLSILCYNCMHLNYICMVFTVLYGAQCGGSYYFNYLVKFYEKGFQNEDLLKQGGEKRIKSWDFGEVVESLGSGKGFLVPIKKMEKGDKFL